MTRLATLFARLGPDPRADGELLRAFLADRDEAAFAQLVRRHGPTVWGVCRRQLAEADAEDAFQATFLVLLRRRPGGDALAGWLYRVAVLTCRGLRRRNARRRTLPLLEVPARPEPATDLDGLLVRLPERERAAVVLVKLHGLTEREAAARVGVPEGTLSARLSRGLRRLRGGLPAVVAVPAGVSEAAVTVAAAGRAAGPGVNFLVTEVLRMFWLKKLAAVGMTAVAVGGLAVGVALRAGPATAQPPPPDDDHARLAALKRQVAELEGRLRQRAADRLPLWEVHVARDADGPLYQLSEVAGADYKRGFRVELRDAADLTTLLARTRGAAGWPRAVGVTVGLKRPPHPRDDDGPGGIGGGGADHAPTPESVRDALQAIRQAGHERVRLDVQFLPNPDTGLVTFRGFAPAAGADPFVPVEERLAEVTKAMAGLRPAKP